MGKVFKQIDDAIVRRAKPAHRHGHKGPPPHRAVAAAARAPASVRSMHRAEPPPSYRALLEIPTLGRILLGMSISRIGGSMLGVAIVLFTLERFGSPVLAGIVTFASVAPGLFISPIVGALLDRHGRTRLIILDQLVGAACLVLIAVLARPAR